MKKVINPDEIFEKLSEKDSIFSTLSEVDTSILKDNCQILEYKKGEEIFTRGRKPVGFLLLVSGIVKIFEEGSGGREQIVRMSKPVSFICYRAVFAGEVHQACARAIEDCVVVMFPEESILSVMQSNFELCLAFIKSFAHELGNSYYRTVSLTQKHIRGRLAESLLLLRDTYGFDNDGQTLKILLSREDVANLSNMNISNAIRTLSAFSGEGLVQIDGRRIRLVNIPELERISNM